MQSAPSPSPSPLDTALRDLLLAFRSHNRPAQSEACIALMHGVRLLDGTCRRWGVAVTDLDDVRQEILFKIVKSLPRLEGELLAPGAWARTVARSVAVDWKRREGKARRDDVELDTFPAPEQEPAPESDGSEILGRAVDAYAALAEAERRAPRGHHVRAWYELRIRRTPAREVAAVVAPAGRGPASPATIWKWAERGHALVLKLASADPDAARADLMRRVVRAVEAPATHVLKTVRGAATGRDRCALFFYAFIAHLSMRRSPDALLGVRRFAQALAGEGPFDLVARRGAEFVAKLAPDDPVPERGRVVGATARRLLACG